MEIHYRKEQPESLIHIMILGKLFTSQDENYENAALTRKEEKTHETFLFQYLTR